MSDNVIPLRSSRRHHDTLEELMDKINQFDRDLAAFGIEPKQAPAHCTIGEIRNYELFAHMRFLAQEARDMSKHPDGIHRVRADWNIIGLYSRLA